MRIGLDYRAATVAPESGIGRQVRALEQAISARPDDQLVRLSEAPIAHPQRETAVCPPWGSPLEGLHRPQVRLRFESRFLPRALRQEKLDIYIATINMGLPLGSKPPGCRYVLVLHDLFQITHRNFHTSALKAKLYRMIDGFSIRWSINKADQIWCPSEFTRSEIERLFPESKGKLHVLPNQVEGFKADEQETVPSSLPDYFWLLVGTREPRKNLPLFLRSWYQLKQSGQTLPDLVLIGAATDVAPELSSLPGLHWKNRLTDSELQAIYQQASCLWQPSYAEGFGLPVIEACSTGTPVAVATGSALEEVAPLKSPRFDPGNPDSLQRCMLAVASSEYPLSRDELIQWSARFNAEAYRTRASELINGLGF